MQTVLTETFQRRLTRGCLQGRFLGQAAGSMSSEGTDRQILLSVYRYGSGHHVRRSKSVWVADDDEVKVGPKTARDRLTICTVNDCCRISWTDDLSICSTSALFLFFGGSDLDRMAWSAKLRVHVRWYWVLWLLVARFRST